MSTTKDGRNPVAEVPLRVPVSVKGTGSMFPGVVGIRRS